MQDLLYVLPDIKPNKHPVIKIGNVFPNQIQWHKLKGFEVKLPGKIVINSFWEIEYWAKYSTTIDPCEKPLQ